MTKEIVKTKTSKNAETLGALYIYIYISILLEKRENKIAKSVFEKICFINNAKVKRTDYIAKIKTAM